MFVRANGGDVKGTGSQSNAVKTELTELLGISYPILLAPMGNVAGGELAGAVSRAGGLGLVGAGYCDANWLRRELALCAGVEPFGVGFITWSLFRNPSALDIALEAGSRAIMFSFGNHEPFIPRVHESGALVICQVQDVAAARRAAESGADVIIAQGTEAGGHGGSRSTFSLVPAIVDAVSPLPVVAAGGVADGRGLAAAVMLGASGVLVGTRFVASAEALAHDEMKRRIVGANGDSTVRTRVFDIIRGYSWPEEYTGRALQNSFTRVWHGHEAELFANLARQRQLYRHAASDADFEKAVIFAGECVDAIRSVEPATHIVKEIAAEAGRLLGW